MHAQLEHVAIPSKEVRHMASSTPKYKYQVIPVWLEGISGQQHLKAGEALGSFDTYEEASEVAATIVAATGSDTNPHHDSVMLRRVRIN
jgi:hypothetical protein